MTSSSNLRSAETCPDAVVLDAYCHGELPADRAGAIGQHVRGCEKCAEAVDVVETGQLYGELLRDDPDSPELRARILETATSSVHSVSGVGLSTDTPAHAKHDERSQRIRELIEHLPPAYGDVIRSCALDGLSFDQAGELLGVPPEIVRNRYQRVREILSQNAHDKGAADEL